MILFNFYTVYIKHPATVEHLNLYDGHTDHFRPIDDYRGWFWFPDKSSTLPVASLKVGRVYNQVSVKAIYLI